MFLNCSFPYYTTCNTINTIGSNTSDSDTIGSNTSESDTSDSDTSDSKQACEHAKLV